MKKTFLAFLCMASLAVMTACGGGNNTKTTTTNDEPQTTEQTAVEQPAVTEEVTPTEATAPSIDDFSAQLKEACGIEAITFPEMTNLKVERSTESEYYDYFMASPVSSDLSKETVQRAYFEAITKIADGNKVYGIGMNGRGDDSFKTYDEYADFIKKNGIYSLATYSYDLNGQRIDINCGVSFGDFSFSAKLK